MYVVEARSMTVSAAPNRIVDSRTPQRDLLGGVLLVTGSCMSLQFGAALATVLFPVVGSWGTSALRLGIAAALLLVVFRPRVRLWRRREWGAVGLFGLTLAAMNGCFYAAIERIPLGVAVTIELLGPLVLAAVLSRRRRDTAWVCLAVAGIALFFLDDLTGHERLDRLGVAFAVAAAGFWALYILTGHRAGRLTSGNGGLAVAVSIAAVALLPLGAGAYPTVLVHPHLLLLALGAAILATVIPYSLEFAAMRRLPKPLFGILLSLEPVFATVAGWLLLGQTASGLAITAVLVVVAASAGSTLPAQR